MVALEYDERLPIQAEQNIVIRLIKQSRAFDARDCALLVRSDVYQFERRAALDQCLQLQSRQLVDRKRRVVRCGVIAHGLRFSLIRSCSVKSLTNEPLGFDLPAD